MSQSPRPHLPPPRQAKGPADAAFCTQAPERGPCRAAIPSWYFDAGMAECRPFLYGGCQVGGQDAALAGGRARSSPHTCVQCSCGWQDPHRSAVLTSAPPCCATPQGNENRFESFDACAQAAARFCMV